MFSAVSTGLSSGSKSIDVLRRIVPVSAANRPRTGNGAGHTVGCESQCWPIETQAKPIRDAARTTAIASSRICVGLRSVGLQNGVRWKPIFTGLISVSSGGGDQALLGLLDLCGLHS